MRKIWIVMALATILSLAYSCGKDNPKGSGNQGSGSGETPVVPNGPGNSQVPKSEAFKLRVTSPNGLVKFIELTPDGKYLICENDGENGEVYSTGDYTVTSDGSYKLGNDGLLTVSPGGSNTTFSYMKNEEQIITGTGETEKPKNTSSNIDKLCRTWVITKTRVSITDAIKANADFNGCDLGQIAQFVRDQGIEVKQNFTGISVATVTLTPLGTIIIQYSDGHVDVAECDLSAIDKDTLSYSWPDSSLLGYDFTKGHGSVSYEGEYCILTLKSDTSKDFKRYDVTVTFVMVEKK